MGEYLYGQENGVHIFDLTKTKPMLEEALEFISKSVKEGKTILRTWVRKSKLKIKLPRLGKN